LFGDGRGDIFDPDRMSDERGGSGGMIPPDCAKRFSRPRCHNAASTAFA
jgi:hypothetical protein